MNKMLRNVLLTLSMICAFNWVQAQTTKIIQGTVKEAKSGDPIVGAAVAVKGTTIGTASDAEGKFTLAAPADAKTLVVKYIGFKTVEVDIAGGIFDVKMEEDILNLDQVVVTALGVKREQKALGYSTQQVDGASLTEAKDPNVVNSLQGKVAGVQITGNSNIGGSARITIRGIHSLTGNNQPLFVVDGIVYDNSNYATSDEIQGAEGYDYGNAAQDINADDIDNVQVLKGPAASALYGSRGANGVIIITTKKGASHKVEKGKSPIGVTFQQDIMFNQISLLPNYQNTYGGGYAPSFEPDENNPAQMRVRMEDDGSWGPKMSGQLVRQWPSYYAYDTANYGKLTPFVPNPNNIKDFYKIGVTSNSHIALDGGNDKGAFRLSYSNLTQTGTVPNSEIKRNTLGFSGSYNFTDKLFADITATYVGSEGTGRPQVGYNSTFSNFQQWWERQLNMQQLQNYINPDGTQHTWNLNYDPTTGTYKPLYWNNPYWEAYKNYETDRRDRLTGRANVGYKIFDWLTITGGVSTDLYQDFRDQRIAVYSVALSQYSQNSISYRESNYELMAKAHKLFKHDIDISAFVGVNRRDDFYRNNYSSTQGGLNVPDLYTIENSIGPILINNYYSTYRQNSLFADFSIGWRGMLFLDVTGRNDWSSSLPSNNNSYFYPSATGSFVFTELMKKSKWFSFGKLRGGWAMVGHDTGPYQLETRPTISQPFNGNGTFVIPNTLNNPDLKPERIYSWEVGLDMTFFTDRIHIDATYYNSVTKDNIFRIQQSSASGYDYRYTNAGTLANQGVELAATFVPVKLKNGFTWSVGFNWAKNYNTVKELYKDAAGNTVNSLVLGSAPFAVTIEARPGMAYGQIVGSDFYYDSKGNKIIDPATGLYEINQNVHPLGSILPDFTGGIYTTLSYKGFSAYFLFDFQSGGHLFSLTNTWGKYDGLLAETAANGVRENGLIAPGVIQTGTDANGNPTSNGTKNTKVVDAVTYYTSNYNGYANARVDVYDASFVKFREMRLTYTFDPKFLQKTFIRGVNVGIIGRNLAILFKNVPNIDPEVATSTNNIQGIEGGNKPPERSIGFTFGFKF